MKTRMEGVHLVEIVSKINVSYSFYKKWKWF